MGVATCPDCGQPASDGAAYCIHCGRSNFSTFGNTAAVEVPLVGEAISVPPLVPPELPTELDGGVVPSQPQTLYSEYPAFPVSITKFILMSVCTVGVYKFYWSYKNWQREARRSGEDLSPFWRAFFSGIWNFVLFARIKELCVREGIPARWSPGWLGFAGLVFAVSWRLPEPYALLAYLSVLPFIPVLSSIQQLNLRYQAIVAEPPNENYSGWNIVAFTLGGLFFLLVVAGSFMGK